MKKHLEQALLRERTRTTVQKNGAALKIFTLIVFIALFGFSARAQSDFTINPNHLLTGYTGAGGDITIPDGVLNIGANAFQGKLNITSVSVPASVSSIGSQAFADCSSLQTITFAPEIQLRSIGNSAFQNSSLTAIDIPASVQSIGTTVFSGDSNLASVTVHWANPAAVTLGNILTGITVFNGIPANVTLYVPAGSETAYQSAPWNLFCYQINSLNILTGYNGAGGNIVIPSGVTGIASSVFMNKNITSVVIPASVQTIGASAFSGCSSLQTVIFEQGSQLTTIGDYAFQNTGLKSIDTPVSVQNIGGGAFSGDSNLSNVTVHWADPVSVTLGDNVFSGIPLNATLYAPTGSETIYQNAPVWRNFYNWTTDDFIITLSNILIGYIGTGGDITIPNEVVGIDSGVFQHNQTITSVTIPASVQTIGSDAFNGCLNLFTVTFEQESQLATIGDYAFYNTPLISIEIPASVQTIGDYAFCYCTLQTITFEQGSQLTTIGNYAFQYSLLTSITIPASVQTIADNAFQYCGLKSITIPASVQTIGASAFSGCHMLGTVTFEQGSQLKTIGDNIFYNSSLTSITIPASVQSIDDQAFWGCPLQTVTFEQGSQLTTIGTAFQNSGLTSITIPVSVQTIADNAFSGCLNLQTVTFEQGSQLKTIGATFQGSHLTSITIPAAVQTIADNAFYNCSQLRTVTFEQGSQLTTIGTAFQNSGLTSITIPASVQTIGASAFNGCSSLQTVTFEQGSQLTTIGTAFQNSGLRSITIPASVQTIGDYAFSGCSSLQTVTFEQGSQLKTINANTFPSCFNLQQVIFGEGSQLTTIGDNTFQNTHLTSITIPASVQTIGDYAFSSCSSLQTVTFEQGSQLKTINANTFPSCFNLQQVIFGEGSQLTTIGDNTFQSTHLTSITIPASVQTIGASAFNGCSSLQTVTFEQGSQLKTIGSGAFNNSRLTSMAIPASVQSIGDGAFNWCGMLQTVTFAQGSQLTTIGTAFQNSSLTSIVIPASVQTIDDSAFNGCSSLQTVTFEQGSQLTTIGAAFHNSSLTSIAIPASVQTIVDGAFNSCGLLQTVTFEQGSQLTTIGANAFQYSGLTSITIPASVQTIGGSAFSYCSGLQKVIFEAGSQLKTIGANAFQNINLTAIDIPASVQNIGGSAFGGNYNLASVTVHWADPETVKLGDYYVFSGIAANATLYVPDYAQSLYEVAPVWQDFYKIVGQIAVAGINLDKTTASLAVTDVLQLNATVLPSNAANKNVTWLSSNPDVATVSASGAVTAKTAGATTITAITNDGGFKATCEVTAFIPTYGVSIGTFSGGKVSVDKTAAPAGETVTLTISLNGGYELDAISAYKTGDESIPIILSVPNAATRTFTMPDYGVTVVATFKKTADQTAVEAAMGAIESGNYILAQTTANTETAVKSWIVSQVNPVIALTGITVSTSNITLSNFTAAVAGTAGNTSGTNGSFSFTVPLTKGASCLTTVSKPGTITATPYTPPDTYGITLVSLANGKVSADKTAATANETVTLSISPNTGYELDSIFAYKTEDATTTIVLNVTNVTTRTFKMPAYGVTVIATFKKTADQTDQTAVETAKNAIESSGYTLAQTTANTEATIKSWIVSQVNTLITSTGITVSTSNITLANFTAAVAGTSGNTAGTNGSFSFTVSLTKGVSSLTTTSKQGTITATPYTPSNTYLVTISSLVNGNVTVNPATPSAAGTQITLTISPSTGYELNTISAYKTDDATTTIVLNVPNATTRTFTMPSYGVTVAVTFKKTADQTAVETAKSAIESSGYTLAQTTANTEATVKSWIVSQVNSLIVSTGITVSTSNITLANFTAAVAGTSGNTAGTNGSFSFTVSLTKGASSLTTTSKPGTITATPYTPPNTYLVTISSLVNGNVTVNPATPSAAGTQITLTISPSTGYELNTISAYKTGDESTAVVLNVSTATTRTFTMPSYGVTVAVTFKKMQEQSDQETLESTKTAIVEDGDYEIAQATGNTITDIKTWLVNTLNVLFGQTYGVQFRSATSIVGDVTITALTPAVAGTETNPEGVNGSFLFTVSLNKDGITLATGNVSGIITATPFTAVKSIELTQPGKLTVRIANTGNAATGNLTLKLSGADADVFTLSSTTINDLAAGEETDITLTPRSGLASGNYTATLTVSGEGLESQSTEITYNLTITGNDVPQVKPMNAYIQNGTLHVSGLTKGTAWSVYSVSGKVIYRAIATDEKASVTLSARGAYVVQSGNKTLKVVY